MGSDPPSLSNTVSPSPRPVPQISSQKANYTSDLLESRGGSVGMDESRNVKSHISSRALLQSPSSDADYNRSGSRTDLQNTLSGRNASRRDVSKTPSRGPLKRLYGLDKSSSKFHDQVSGILCGEEYKRWVSDLRGNDLMGLVDYLDQVCHPVSLFAPRSSHRRFSIFSILPFLPPRSVCANSGVYAAIRRYCHHHAHSRLSF